MEEEEAHLQEVDMISDATFFFIDFLNDGTYGRPCLAREGEDQRAARRESWRDCEEKREKDERARV